MNSNTLFPAKRFPAWMLVLLVLAPSFAYAQLGGGGLNYARTQTDPGESSGVWSDNFWTADGATTTSPSAGDTVFVGDSSIPGGGFPASFAGTVTLSVGASNESALALHVGNVAAGDIGILNIDSGGNLSIGQNVTLNQGEINVSNGLFTVANEINLLGGTLDVGSGQTISASTLTLNGPGAVADLAGIGNVEDLNLTSGTLNLNSGADVTVSDTMTVSSGSSLARNGGSLTVKNLIFDNGISAVETVTVDDEITNLSIANSSNLIFSQSIGQMEGIKLTSLTIDQGSTFEVNFDALTQLHTDEADWVLRLAGDQRDLLGLYLFDGRIFSSSTANATSNPLTLGYHYDATNNLTFLTAIPEPGSLTFGLLLIGGLGFRRKRSILS